MQLWNDYEGKTLDGTFPIEALLSTEGRNACFATHGRDGRPAVLRLTEALNDQQEMRARYRAIRDVGQHNLVAIEDFGDVELDGIPLIYLVMEPTEENLGEIILERPLSLDETGEVATSLVSALEALHAHGLVHGQVTPANVLAAGQVVKLRSDCARPAPEGEEGERARAEDVFGLADVLNRCLTQQRLYDASDALALPEPYASIVRHVVRGSWNLEEVAAELRRYVRPAPPIAAAVTPAPAGAIAAPSAQALSVDSTVAQPGSVNGSAAGRQAAGSLSSRTASELSRNGRKTTGSAAAGDPQLPLPYASETEPEETSAAAPAPMGRGWRGPAASDRESPTWLWIGGAVAVFLLVLLGWHFSSGSKAPAAKVGSAPASSAPEPTPGASTSAGTALEAGRSAGAPSGAAPSIPATAPALTSPRSTMAEPAHAAAPSAHGAQRAAVWRVIAYTYNVEAQAQAKARAVAARHGDLHPEVFSRTGKAPYLVTLGGPLTEQQAAAMRQRARSEGLARDVYMQNYTH